MNRRGFLKCLAAIVVAPVVVAKVVAKQTQSAYCYVIGKWTRERVVIVQCNAKFRKIELSSWTMQTRVVERSELMKWEGPLPR
jgi:hypothetical protein